MNRCLLLLLVVITSCCANAQPVKTDTAAKLFAQKTFFNEHGLLMLSFSSDFHALKHKKVKGAFQPAVVSLPLANGQTVSQPIQIAARGEFRRQNCTMPSLMVNFKSNGPGPLSSLKKLKMVCTCNANAYSQELLLKEFLVYKIYNLLTDMSFKVRLAKVTYVDESKKEKANEQYAFFIEDVDALAKRNHCLTYEKKITQSIITDRAQSTLMNIFEFMIGNLDWSIPNRHNIRLIQAKSDSLSAPFTVPYDFDFCGLVDAPYAFPQEEFNVAKVTDRLYRGHAANEAEVSIATQLFLDKKDAIYGLINDFSLLSEGERKSMIKFLDGFYQTVNNKRDVREIFINASRQN